MNLFSPNSRVESWKFLHQIVCIEKEKIYKIDIDEYKCNFHANKAPHTSNRKTPAKKIFHCHSRPFLHMIKFMLFSVNYRSIAISRCNFQEMRSTTFKDFFHRVRETFKIDFSSSLSLLKIVRKKKFDTKPQQKKIISFITQKSIA
jgi:hypothetical protein